MPGSSAPLSVFAMYLGPFLHLRLRLLYLCLCLICRLLRCIDCGYGWVVRSFVCVCYVPGSVPPSAFAFAVFVPVPDLSAPPLLCLWLCLDCPLLCLCLLVAWIRSSICICVYCVSVLMLGSSAPPSTSAVSLALPKALKKKLINVAFLDSLGNYVQSASSFRFIARSIARSIILPKIGDFYRDLYRAPGLGARISGIKCRKSCDNTPSRDNLDTRAAIYIVWRCLALGLRH